MGPYFCRLITTGSSIRGMQSTWTSITPGSLLALQVFLPCGCWVFVEHRSAGMLFVA